MNDAGPRNIELTRIGRFLAGMAIGAGAFVIAKALVSVPANDRFSHDLALTRNIGFAFPALAGLFLGWLQRSLSRMVWNAVVGSVTGYVYAVLCDEQANIFTTQFEFPVLCGGLFALLAGSNRDCWVEGMFHRFLKGGLAGIACGAAYFAVANVIALSTPTRDRASLTMWLGGTAALAAGGGFYILLMVWAVGLSRRLHPAPAADAT